VARLRNLVLVLAALALLAVSFWFRKHPSTTASVPSARALATGRHATLGPRASDEVAPRADDQAHGATDAKPSEWYVDPAQPTVTLSGQVLLNDMPSEGIEVRLADEQTSSGALVHAAAKTDREGHFRFSGMPCVRGSYRVSAAATNATPGWNVLDGCTTRNDIDIRLETCKNALYGTVSDASGGNVAGAKIFLARVPEHAVVTEADGNYRLCVGPGSGTLQVTASGYGLFRKRVSTYGTTRQDVSLMPSAGLVGSVVFSGGKQPAPFALVTLSSEITGESEAETQAAEDGTFRFSGIAPARYRVTARVKNARSSVDATVGVFAGSEATIVITIDKRARVTGAVVSELGPEKGARISLGFWGTREWSSSATTDASGAFVLDDAPIGTPLLRVDNMDVETPRTLQVSERGAEGVRVQVRSKPQLRIRVTQDNKPVRDANVSVRSSGTSQSQRTSPKGIAQIRGLPSGRYRIVAEFEGSFGVIENVAASVRASQAEGDEVDAHIELTAGKQIRGRVIDDAGRAVDGATVSLSIQGSTEDSGAVGITDQDGRFQGGPLRGPSKYAVKVSRAGTTFEPKTNFEPIYVPETGPVSPADGVWIVRAQNQEIVGRVVTADGEPAADVRVTVTPDERHASDLATVFTSAEGTFRIRGLAVGPFAVTAYDSHGAEAEKKHLRLPSQAITLTLPWVSEIHGSLRGFSRTPTIIAWQERGYDWRDIRYGVIEGDKFSIRGLSRAKYFVAAASADGARTDRVDLTSAPSATLDLVASGKRTIVGHARDLITGAALANLTCQSAPYIEGSRSPVVIPTSVFVDGGGRFEFRDVPAADLYMWCLKEGQRGGGGIARLPSDLAGDVTLWGYDAHDKPPVDVRLLGFTMDDDFIFSRRVLTVDEKGIGAQSGIHVGDVIAQVEGKDTSDAGTGVVRSIMAFTLAEKKTVALVVSRGGALLPIELRAK
jgi:Carboxypeptidase regulatory-like domain